MTHSYETWLIHMRHDSIISDMPHSYEAWFIRMRHDSFIWVMTHSYETWPIHMRHDSSYETWFILMRQTHSYEAWFIGMSHDSFMWDMTHSYATWFIGMRHDSFIYPGRLIKKGWDLIECYQACCIHIKHLTHSYETGLIYISRTIHLGRWIDGLWLWSKEPPPPGGVSYLLCSLIKNREAEDPSWRTTPKIDQFWGWFFRGRPLPPGSWSGNIVNRKPSPGGGVSFDQLGRNDVWYASLGASMPHLYNT